MVKFFRNLIIIVIILALLLYGALWYVADDINATIREPLFIALVGDFEPGDGEDYSFDVSIRVWPPVVQVRNFELNADLFALDGDPFEDFHIGVGWADFEFMPLYREGTIVLIDGGEREFEGRISNYNLARRLERLNEFLNDLEITEINGRCRIEGLFGRVSYSTMYTIGDWAVDDRGVATLINRRYHNLDSPVPMGFSEEIERQFSLDVRITLLDEELVARDVAHGENGLWISATEQEDLEDTEDAE